MALATKAAIQASKCADEQGGWCRRLVSGNERVPGVEWWSRGAEAVCFILLRPSGSGEDTYHVSEKAPLDKWI